MKIIKFGLLILLLAAFNSSYAQYKIITNARIIKVNGPVIERGTIVINGNLIEYVSSDLQQARDYPGNLKTSSGINQEQEVLKVDARGMTVMPGMIDTHRHVAPGALKELLGSGFTTVMDMAGWQDQILALRQKLADGELSGPELLVVGPAFTSPGGWPVPICRGNPECLTQFVVLETEPAEVRMRVQELAEDDVDAIKVMYQNESAQGKGVTDVIFTAIAEEAHSHGMDVVVHTDSVSDMEKALALGADRFVHSPLTGRADESNLARMLADNSIPVATTVSWQSEAAQSAIGQGDSPESKTRLENILANIRHLWDEGVVVAFGTDSPTVLGGAEFMVEVKELNKVLSEEEIITALTRNAAIFLGRERTLGTIEEGKTADLIMLDGNPLVNLDDLSKVKLVIKNGQVVVDKR